MDGSGSSSILQSGMPESKSVMDRDVFGRLILMVFSLPNLFFSSFGESTAKIFPLFMIAILSQRYSAVPTNLEEIFLKVVSDSNEPDN